MSNISKIKDKIRNFLHEVQLEIWDNENCDFLDVWFEFDISYLDYGSLIETNVLRLNYSGSNDWFYFISVPDADMKLHEYHLDMFPIFYADNETAEISQVSKNFKELFSKWFPDDKRLEIFSNLSFTQEIPKMGPLFPVELPSKIYLSILDMVL